MRVVSNCHMRMILLWMCKGYIWSTVYGQQSGILGAFTVVRFGKAFPRGDVQVERAQMSMQVQQVPSQWEAHLSYLGLK